MVVHLGWLMISSSIAMRINMEGILFSFPVADCGILYLFVGATLIIFLDKAFILTASLFFFFFL